MRERDALHVRVASSRSGERATVRLTTVLPPGVHIEPHQPAEPNLIPTVVETDGLADLRVTYPPPSRRSLGWNDVELQVLDGEVTFELEGVPTGADGWLSGTLRFQPCIGGACLPPRTVEWTALLDGEIEYTVLDALAPTGIVSPVAA
jgi:hypothetical protein